MNEQERIAIVKDTFDTVSEWYDMPVLRFFRESANHLASLLPLTGNEHVLDVATGTGHTALRLAGYLPKGKVSGVDFSKGMLEQARKKAASLNTSNVEFIERDMQALGFPENHFDAAVCSFGIFFIDDMDVQLSRIVNCVKPGGNIAISCFQENYFHPLKNMLLDQLVDYGVELPPQTWKRIANEAGSIELFTKAGLRDIRLEVRNVGYYLKNALEWWDVVWNAGYRRMVSQLSLQDQERFRGEHLQKIEGRRTSDGIWLDVGVLFTIGTKV